MKKLLTLLAFVAALWAVPASAQCIAVGGINNVPQPGMTCGSEPIVPTYSAGAVALVAVTGATDIACIAGASGKVIRLQAIRFSGTVATANVTTPVVVLKRASLDTAGTPATGLALPVASKLDSGNAASVATLVSYTANPTINDSSPGVVDVGQYTLNLTTNLGAAPVLAFDYIGRNYSQAPVLRSAAEQICVNLNATAFANATAVNVSFRWTELAQ